MPSVRHSAFATIRPFLFIAFLFLLFLADRSYVIICFMESSETLWNQAGNMNSRGVVLFHSSFLA